MTTIFTKIINKELDADIVYEDSLALAFNDILPQAPIHILIIPKKEIPTINDIADSDKLIVGHLFIVAKKIAKSMNIAENGYRIIFNCNQDAGQTVNHIHIHFLGGRKFTWPAG